MTTPRFGILILGCGWAATIHSRVLRRMAGVELSYASRDLARSDAFRRRFGGRRAYGSYDHALRDPAIDAVLIATPTSTHRELATWALAAGKHVIVEKPVFLHADDVDAVASTARCARRRVLVAENYFYKPITRYLRDIVSSGGLGDVRFVTINATKRQHIAGWRDDPSLSGGGALFEAGVHWINFASNIGLTVASVSATRVGPAANGADRSSLVLFRYSNGAVGTLAHSWELDAPLGGLRLSKVQGTEGAVTFESNGFARVTTGARRSIALGSIRDPLGYRAMHADFLSALRTGAREQFTLDMARRDLVLLEAASSCMQEQPQRQNPGDPRYGALPPSAAVSQRDAALR